MKNTGNLDVALHGDREIVLTRTFGAPRALVWKAMTTPDIVRRWWGPRGTHLSVCEIDLRIGGRWRYVLVRHDGKEVGFNGTYLELDAPDRMVSTEVYEPFPDAGATVTATYVEVGGKTTVTSRSRYPSPEVRDAVIASGMEGGAAETFDRLDELLLSH